MSLQNNKEIQYVQDRLYILENMYGFQSFLFFFSPLNILLLVKWIENLRYCFYMSFILKVFLQIMLINHNPIKLKAHKFHLSSCGTVLVV